VILTNFQRGALAALTDKSSESFCREDIAAASERDDYVKVQFRDLVIYLYADQYDIFRDGVLVDKLELEDVSEESRLISSFIDALDDIMRRKDR
jgi:hypothetical protein